MELSDSALKKLDAYAWPGNIRELQHLIEKSVIMSNSNLLTDKDIMINKDKGALRKQTLNLSENEKLLIAEALEKNRNNYTKAADELGITRRTLYNKLKHYGF
jgi:transcriptional regulator with PAS, ATPase and Fis domain